MEFRRLELNGGRVLGKETWQLLLPPVRGVYADAQIDDYGLASGRATYPWQPGTMLSLRARFSHGRDLLRGTAGFGFWNAPLGDPTIKWPALPQAAWFFFASEPSDLPYRVHEPGRGWFAATLDAATKRALLLAPLAPLLLLLNQVRRLRSLVWPPVQRALGISFATNPAPMTEWCAYELHWLEDGCAFIVDGRTILRTSHSPHGPLGFVCWIDNQYLVATPRGRLSWGTVDTAVTQRLEIDALSLRRL